jgi:hypothetical protein
MCTRFSNADVTSGFWPVPTLAAAASAVVSAVLSSSIDRDIWWRCATACSSAVMSCWRSRVGTFGLGAYITGYIVPPNLRDSYGAPVSVHAFLRCRLQPASPVHMH